MDFPELGVQHFCTPAYNVLKFPVTPPAGVPKTWKITATPEYVKIKCNNLEVLHFILNNENKSYCTSTIKGRTPEKVRFASDDSATKMFTSDLAGK